MANNGILEECQATAIKFKIALELTQAMRERHISKMEMAPRPRPSRSGLERLLDPANTSITLNTMAKVAHVLGKRVEFSLR